jgi:amino acid permease
LKSQIGLGVLSLPNALGMLGIVPGILCLLAIAAIMTWSGYIIAEIKLRHKRVCELSFLHHCLSS